MTAASAAARRLVNTSSSITGEPSGPVSGTRQFGYSSMVPGWFCDLPVADRVGQRHAEQPGRRPGQVAVQGLDRLLDLGVVLQGTPGPEIVQPGLRSASSTASSSFRVRVRMPSQSRSRT